MFIKYECNGYFQGYSKEIFCTEIYVKEDDRYCMNQSSTRFFLRQKYRVIYQIWDTVYQDYGPAVED